jgi:hypothetical protein
MDAWSTVDGVEQTKAGIQSQYQTTCRLQPLAELDLPRPRNSRRYCHLRLRSSLNTVKKIQRNLLQQQQQQQGITNY